jgi:hypothetical protein
MARTTGARGARSETAHPYTAVSGLHAALAMHWPLAVKAAYVRSRCWLDGRSAVSSYATDWRADGLAEFSKAQQVMSQRLASLLGLRRAHPGTTTSGFCAAKEKKEESSC